MKVWLVRETPDQDNEIIHICESKELADNIVERHNALPYFHPALDLWRVEEHEVLTYTPESVIETELRKFGEVSG